MVGIVEWVVNAIMAFIDKIGYGGIFGLMTLESACIPIPSEVVMPFSGNLAYLYPDRYNIVVIGLVGALGCLAGSLLAYYAGLYLGRPFVLKYGKYVFLREEHLRKAEWWFERHGDATAFFSRLMPIVRTFISFPAGIGKMNVKKFALYSFVGSLPWTFALAYIGYWLGKRWDVIFQYGHYLDALVIVAFVILVLWYVLKHRKNKMTLEKEDGETGGGGEKGANGENAAKKR